MDDKDNATDERSNEIKEKINELRYLAERLVFKQSPAYNNGKAYFYFVSLNGEVEETKSIEGISKEDFEGIKNQLMQIMRQTHGKVYYTKAKEKKGTKKKADELMVVEEKKEGEEEEKEVHFKPYEAIKQVDKTFALQLMQSAKKQAWFSEVVEQLGMTTLFMILQIAHIPPEQWYEEIKKYKDDPEAFLRWADDWVVALYEAREDAESLLEIRSKYYYCIAERESLRAELIRYKALLQEALTNLNAATSMLNKNQMQKYTLWITMRKMSETQPIMYVGNKEGDKNGE